jgi:hypothetical protein
MFSKYALSWLTERNLGRWVRYRPLSFYRYYPPSLQRPISLVYALTSSPPSQIA